MNVVDSSGCLPVEEQFPIDHIDGDAASRDAVRGLGHRAPVASKRPVGRVAKLGSFSGGGDRALLA